METPEALSKIYAAVSGPELWDSTLDYFLSNGIDKVSYHAVPTGGHEAKIRTYGFPEEWVCHYIGDGLQKVDPIPALAAVKSAPFRWSDTRDMGELSPANLAYLRELESRGLGDGLAFYVFGPKVRNAYVGLGFGQKSNCPSAEWIAQFQMVAQMAHLKYCKLSEEETTSLPNLSDRERQVLEWVAQGKSNAVIADILEVSPHTVDTLVRRLFTKLNVTDRTSAAIKGLGSGLLQYNALSVT